MCWWAHTAQFTRFFFQTLVRGFRRKEVGYFFAYFSFRKENNLLVIVFFCVFLVLLGIFFPSIVLVRFIVFVVLPFVTRFPLLFS